MKPATCKTCGASFMRRTSNRYCSDTCRPRREYDATYHQCNKERRNHLQRMRRAAIASDPVRYERHKAYDREWKRKHAAELQAKRKERYWRDPAKYRAAVRKHNLKKKWGLTESQYNTLWRQQNGVCGICGRSSGKKKLAIDHDHESGAIRGLLCSNCNTGLGLLGDDIEILARAIAYLHPPLTLLRGA